MKAGTTEELGLKFSQSAKFLGSKLGCEIVAKLKAEQAISEKKTIRSSLKIGQKLQIIDSEYKNGVRRKEFFRGVLHTVFKVVVKFDCTKCGSSNEIDLFILIHDEAVEVAVAYNKKGMVLGDEDGRKGYAVWPGGARVSTLLNMT